ncbi:hypothetical protein PAXRUDRAFT_834958 [Paxillus rubicundulus Ve08.2h10]|uniref:Uncharacterized protein n=1 Tax=Paxillus rubicundulus Ve08.2h10 TaxID=930991 RepID=A0A0D0CQA7_9AGAM|nr:hypothetical protein PAXRUDRAFT_834958 [Paxillus rubicundulus Ve08.2h10]
MAKTRRLHDTLEATTTRSNMRHILTALPSKLGLTQGSRGDPPLQTFSTTRLMEFQFKYTIDRIYLRAGASSSTGVQVGFGVAFREFGIRSSSHTLAVSSHSPM